MWQQLVFPHIPKTAGWALHAALLPIFGEAHSLRVNTEEDQAALRALTPAEFAAYRYVSGHFTFDDIKEKCGSDALLVSVLRDPVRRVISEFNYVAGWTEHPYYERSKDLRLSEYVYPRVAFLRGLQCDWLTGCRHAEQAMTVLRRRYAVVGTVANYDAFLAALSRLIGREVRIERTNVTNGQGRLDLDSRLCGLLLDLATEDQGLIDCITALPGGVFIGAP